MDKTFWVVWNPMGGPPTVRHPSRTQATKEAERLAASFPGREFYVLKALTKTVSSTVRTTSLGGSDDEEIPF